MTFVKGHKLATGRPKGSKNRATLLQEERRAIFDERISQKWEEVIDQLRPEYIADQYLGKAEEKIALKVKLSGEEQIAELAKETSARMKGYDTDTTTTSGA